MSALDTESDGVGGSVANVLYERAVWPILIGERIIPTHNLPKTNKLQRNGLKSLDVFLTGLDQRRKCRLPP